MGNRIQKSYPQAIAATETPKLPKGVTLTPKGRYHARVCRNGQILHVGVYDTVKEAVDARAAFLSRAINPIAAAPVMEQEQPVEEVPVVVPVVPELPPQAAKERIYQTDRPDLCPACRSPLWGPCSGGGMICLQCGLQKLPFVPAGAPSRAQYADSGWRREHCQGARSRR